MTAIRESQQKQQVDMDTKLRATGTPVIGTLCDSVDSRICGKSFS